MAGVVVGGVFNAFSFAGAGYLFHMIDKNGYSDEMKRHNMAMEKLSAAKEKWYENQVKNKNRIHELRQQLSDAILDENTTNKALDSLRKVLSITYEGKKRWRNTNILLWD